MSNSNFRHYTSQSGLMGIIRNEAFWATNIKFLNDENEFTHTLNLINEIIKPDILNKNEIPIHKEFIDKVEAKLKYLDRFTADGIFTLSFSQETDLLSQWRGYCPNNNGYCLLFELDLILEKAIDTYETAYIFDCIYKKDEKQNKIRDLLNLYWSKYQKNTNDKELIGELMNEIILLASHFKDETFSEEKEKRIVVKLGQHQFNKIKFREGRFSITPYIELTAPKDSLKKICMALQ